MKSVDKKKRLVVLLNTEDNSNVYIIFYLVNADLNNITNNKYIYIKRERER
jgi:hypothetical protein